MRYVSEKEEPQIIEIFNKVIEIAKNSTCKKSKCGSIIINNNEIIGQGFNSPSANLEEQRRCLNSKDSYNKKVTDKTCCIHAEQRAMINALQTNPNKIKNSRLYFIRLDNNNNILKAGKPYCTICSKMALDIGISEFVLWHNNGICIYNTQEYNDLSFEFEE
jgi:deoxycytidylate deaminase